MTQRRFALAFEAKSLDAVVMSAPSIQSLPPIQPVPSIQILRPGDESKLEAFLYPRLESSMILLSNLRQAGLVDRGERFEGTYYATFSASSGDEAAAGGEITGIIAHCWQGNLVLQAPAHLTEILEKITAAPERPIRGLLGLSEQVGRAMQLLGWREADIQLDEEEGLYALALGDLVVPDELRSGRLRGRRAELRDLDQVSAWRLGYWLEALGADDTPELRDRCRGEIGSSIDEGTTWVLEDLEVGEEPVACTSFNATIREAVQVGGVWTPPESRGRGYGRAAVAASLLDARAEGVERAILFTGDDNVPAIRAYAALGFQRIGDHRVVLAR